MTSEDLTMVDYRWWLRDGYNYFFNHFTKFSISEQQEIVPIFLKACLFHLLTPCWLSWLCCVGLPVARYSHGTKQCIWTVWNRRIFPALATSLMCSETSVRPSFGQGLPSAPQTQLPSSQQDSCMQHSLVWWESMLVPCHEHSEADTQLCWRKETEESRGMLYTPRLCSWLNINTHSLYWKGDTTVSQFWTPSVSTQQHIIHFPCLNRSCPHFTTAVVY